MSDNELIRKGVHSGRNGTAGRGTTEAVGGVKVIAVHEAPKMQAVRVR